ncbi:sarcosine oxidase subunit gamma [Tropicibacter sp. Alg240-R139]|uniref:sarcosine oxidase subunit gamma n=1 Tax=Tropicibacter sp. Alg240-R139 TaxID=2305991 RepID=UPI0013DEAA5A|nr:sarcosine oxidase subunit gamma [Tropicibacter sp. Alg240-R139]
MDKLSALSPCSGLLPLTIGAAKVVEVEPGHLTSVAPYNRQHDKLSKAMKAVCGVAYPQANGLTRDGDTQAIWFGHAQAILVGPAADAGLAKHAALTDQSDAWAVVTLSGDAAEDVLARLVPVDVRLAHFAVGQAVRTQLMHLSVSLARVDEGTFQIMAFRSMAHTLVHDLKTAMEAVAARG